MEQKIYPIVIIVACIIASLFISPSRMTFAQVQPTNQTVNPCPSGSVPVTDSAGNIQFDNNTGKPVCKTVDILGQFG